MNRISAFVKEHRFWVFMLLGVASFWLCIRFAIIALSFFVGYEMVLAGIVVLFLCTKLWNIAYTMQDDAWYWRRYKKTGDDFEHRYDRCFTASEIIEHPKMLPVDVRARIVEDVMYDESIDK